eukprot:scaffold304_cov409-Prasinococcus_capsulatus_cf.AAC.5
MFRGVSQEIFVRNWPRHVLVLPRPETPIKLWAAAQRAGLIIISTGQSHKSLKALHKSALAEQDRVVKKYGSQPSHPAPRRPIIVPFPTFKSPSDDIYHVNHANALCEDRSTGVVSPCQDRANERQNLVASVGYYGDEELKTKSRQFKKLGAEAKLALQVDQMSQPQQQGDLSEMQELAVASVDIKNTEGQVIDRFSNAAYCISSPGEASVGAGCSSPRLQQAVSLGCVPVIIRNKCDYTPPFNSILDYTNFTIDYKHQQLVRRKNDDDVNLHIIQRQLRQLPSTVYFKAKDKLACASE